MTTFKKALLFFLTAVLVLSILAGAEFFLRLSGWQPGFLGNFYQFSRVDSLTIRPDYTVDESGIMKLSDEGRLTVNAFVSTEKFELDLNALWTDIMLPDLALLTAEFHILAAGYDNDEIKEYAAKHEIDEENIAKMQDAVKHAELSIFAHHLLKTDSLNDFQQAVLQYIKQPINADGFRSIEFKNYQTPQLKVLLLGDSFTWGKSAMPLWNSFADRLLARGYIVFNTGIVCTDPAQYAVVAEKLIPVLKPDVVIVNYYDGNDNMYYYREPKAGEWTYHFTKAGLLDARPLDYYFTAEEAYLHHLSQVTIPETNIINRICASTVLTTKLWMSVTGEQPFQLKYAPPVPAGKIKPERFDKPVSGFYINRIKSVCSENGSEMILSVIPRFLDAEGNLYSPDLDSLKNEMTKIFSDTSVHVIRTLVRSDFAGGNDDHFNSDGAKKYADFLEDLIKGKVGAGLTEK